MREVLGNVRTRAVVRYGDVACAAIGFAHFDSCDHRIRRDGRLTVRLRDRLRCDDVDRGLEAARRREDEVGIRAYLRRHCAHQRLDRPGRFLAGHMGISCRRLARHA